MKKLVILTSVLALTACGGGSGGSGSSPKSVVLPSNTLTDAQRAAQNINSRFVGMNSFVVVGGSNPTTNPNARSAITGTRLSDGGIRFDLTNAKLHTTTFTEDFVNPDSGAYITFKTDENGKIIEIDADGPMQFPDGVHARRTSDENDIFVGDTRFDSYEENGTDGQGNVTYTHQYYDFPNFQMKYNSFAATTDAEQENNVRLSYSDFGSLGLATEDEEIDDDGEYFAGGYAVKRTDLKNNNTDYTKMNELAQNIENNKFEFTGTARGMVSVGDDDEPKDIPLIDNSAKLTFTNGTSVLNTTFSNWYNVSATMGNNGQLSGISFDKGNTEKTNFENDFKFANENDGHYDGKQTQYHPDKTEGPNVISEGFIEYYGDNGNPAEAVGTIKYVENDAALNNERMLFRMGFGLVRN